MKKVIFLIFMLFPMILALDTLDVEKKVYFCYNQTNCKEINSTSEINYEKGFFKVVLFVQNNWKYNVKGILWDIYPNSFNVNTTTDFIKHDDKEHIKIKILNYSSIDDTLGNMIEYFPKLKDEKEISKLFFDRSDIRLDKYKIISPNIRDDGSVTLYDLKVGENITFVYYLNTSQNLTNLLFGKAVFTIKMSNLIVVPDKITIDFCYPSTDTYSQTILIKPIEKYNLLKISASPFKDINGNYVSNLKIKLNKEMIDPNNENDVEITVYNNYAKVGTYYSELYILDENNTFIYSVPIIVNIHRYQTTDENETCYYPKPWKIGDFVIAPKPPINFTKIPGIKLNDKILILNVGNTIYDIKYKINCGNYNKQGALTLEPGIIKEISFDYNYDSSCKGNITISKIVSGVEIYNRSYNLSVSLIKSIPETDYIILKNNFTISSNYPIIKVPIYNNGKTSFDNIYVAGAKYVTGCVGTNPGQTCNLEILLENITKNKLEIYINGIKKEFNFNVTIINPEIQISNTSIVIPGSIKITNTGKVPIYNLGYKIIENSNLSNYLISYISVIPNKYTVNKIDRTYYTEVFAKRDNTLNDKPIPSFVLYPNETIKLYFDFDSFKYALDKEPTLKDMKIKILDKEIILKKPHTLDNFSLNETYFYVVPGIFENSRGSSLSSNIFKIKENAYNYKQFLFDFYQGNNENTDIFGIGKFLYNNYSGGNIRNYFGICLTKGTIDDCLNYIPKCGNGILDEGEDCDYNSLVYGCGLGKTCSKSCVCVKTNETRKVLMIFNSNSYNLNSKLNQTIEIKFVNITYNNKTANITVLTHLNNLSFYGSLNINISVENNFSNENLTYSGFGLTDISGNGYLILNGSNTEIIINYSDGTNEKINNISLENTNKLILNDLDYNGYGIVLLTLKGEDNEDSIHANISYKSNQTELNIIFNKIQIINNKIYLYNSILYNREKTYNVFKIIGEEKRHKIFVLKNITAYIDLNNETLTNNKTKIYLKNVSNILNCLNLEINTENPSKNCYYSNDKIVCEYKSNITNIKAVVDNTKKTGIIVKSENFSKVLNSLIANANTTGTLNLEGDAVYYDCIYYGNILYKCFEEHYGHLILTYNGNIDEKAYYTQSYITNISRSLTFNGLSDKENYNHFYLLYNLSKIIIKPPEPPKNYSTNLYYFPKYIYLKIFPDTEDTKEITIKNIGTENIKDIKLEIVSKTVYNYISLDKNIVELLKPGEEKTFDVNIYVPFGAKNGIYPYELKIKTRDKTYVIPIILEVSPQNISDNILDLEVNVTCSGGTLEDGTCVINKGESYTITITTTSKDIDFYVAAGFKMKIISQSEPSSSSSSTTYIIKVTCENDECNLGSLDTWVPKVSSSGSSVSLGITPPSPYVKIYNPTKEEPTYVSLNINQIYYTVGIKSEKIVTASVSTTTDIPGGYFDLVATIKNNDPTRYITNVKLDFISSDSIGFGEDCGADICITGDKITGIDLAPGQSITRTYRVQASDKITIGQHDLTLVATGYLGTELLKDNVTVTYKVVNPPSLYVEAQPYLEGLAIPTIPFKIKGTITNNGDYPVTVGISTEYTHNLNVYNCIIANPTLGAHSSTDFVCDANTIHAGDGDVIFKVSGTFNGYTISTLKEVVVKGVKDVGISVYPSSISLPNLKPGNTYSLKFDIINTGYVPLYVVFKKINGSAIDWVSCDDPGIINPGESKKVTMNISIPEDIEKGKTYDLTYEFYGESLEGVTYYVGSTTLNTASYATKYIKLLLNTKNTKRKTLYLDTKSSCSVINNNSICGLNISIEDQKTDLRDLDGNNEKNVFINSLNPIEYNLTIANLQNYKVCATLGSKETWIYFDPYYVCLNPHEQKMVKLIIKPNTLISPGNHQIRLYSVVNGGVDDIFYLNIYMPMLLRYSPKEINFGEKYVTEKPQYSIKLCNDYSSDITAFLSSTDLVKFNTNTITIPSKTCKNVSLYLDFRSKTGQITDTVYIIQGKVRYPIKVYGVVKGPTCKLTFDDYSSYLKIDKKYGDHVDVNVKIQCIGFNKTEKAILEIISLNNDQNWIKVGKKELDLNNGLFNENLELQIPENTTSGVHSFQIKLVSDGIEKNDILLDVVLPSVVELKYDTMTTIDRGFSISKTIKIINNANKTFENLLIKFVPSSGDNSINPMWIYVPEIIENYVPAHDYSIFSYTISIPSYVNPGNYKGKLIITGTLNGKQETIEKDIYITVKEPLVVPTNMINVMLNENFDGYAKITIANNGEDTTILKNITILGKLDTDKINFSNILPFSMYPKTTKTTTIYIHADQNTDSKWYFGNIIIKDFRNVTYNIPIKVYVPVNWCVDNKCGLSFYTSTKTIEMYGGESQDIVIDVKLNNAIYNEYCGMSKGAKLNVGIIKSNTDKINLSVSKIDCLEVGRDTKIIIHVNTNNDTYPGIYKYYVSLQLSNGQIVYIPIEIKILYPYTANIYLEKYNLYPNETTNLVIYLKNNKPGTLKGTIIIKGYLDYWSNKNEINFSLVSGEEKIYYVQIKVPQHQDAGTYTGSVIINTTIPYEKSLSMFVPVKYYINLTDLNGKTIDIYDLIPKVIPFEEYVDNKEGFQLLVYSSDPDHIKFKCGNDVYKEYTLQTFSKGEKKECYMKITMPDNTEGLFTKKIYIKDSLNKITTITFNINEKKAIEIIPDKYVYEGIPGQESNLSFLIRNRSPVNIILVPKLEGYSGIPINLSWFNLPNIIVLEANTTKHITIPFTMGNNDLGNYFGIIKFISNYGHYRKFDFMIKSAVDVIVDVY